MLTHVLQRHLTATWSITWLSQWQWNTTDGMCTIGVHKNFKYNHTWTKHDKTVCIVETTPEGLSDCV